MKVTMRYNDLIRSDGFPANIDRNKIVVVQIKDKELPGIVLYSCKETGLMSSAYLPIALNKKYSSKIYIITK